MIKYKLPNNGILQILTLVSLCVLRAIWCFLFGGKGLSRISVNRNIRWIYEIVETGIKRSRTILKRRISCQIFYYLAHNTPFSLIHVLVANFDDYHWIHSNRIFISPWRASVGRWIKSRNYCLHLIFADYYLNPWERLIIYLYH